MSTLISVGQKAMRRPDWDVYFMLHSEIAKLRSNCIARHVGAVIVKDNRQIATGYNGTPSGIKNCFDGGCERCMSRVHGKISSGKNLERCLCTHAEANAIIQCALFGNAGSTKGATLYSTFSPCIECSKMAISVGIKRIVVLSDYSEDATSLLSKADITLLKLEAELLSNWIEIMKKGPQIS